MARETKTEDLPLITVLGGSGFIGSAVVKEFSQHPVRVRVVSRDPERSLHTSAAQVETFAADVTDPQQLVAAVAGSTAVINLLLYTGSWRTGSGGFESERVNVGVIRELVKLLADGNATPSPLIIQTGSVSQMGVPMAGLIDGTEPDAPITSYAQQKLDAENILTEATSAGLVRGFTLRLSTAFGADSVPGASAGGVVERMTRKALADEAITMWHDGTVRRDFMHVSDIASAFAAAYEHADALVGRGGWVLGSGVGMELGEVFNVVAKEVSEYTGTPPVPVTTVTPPPEALESDFYSLTVDPIRFSSVTGWKPQLELRSAMRSTVRALAGT